MLQIKMEYEVIAPRSKAEVEAAISTDDPEELSYAVLSAALYADDREWAEGICLRLSDHAHFNVRGNAILGLGHIARIHGVLNELNAKPVIEAALKDENAYVKGHANEAANDVEVFLKWKVERPE
jgi:hypothetical protein